MSLWDTLSDDRLGLLFVNQRLQMLVLCQYVHKYLCYHSSLDTWMVIHVTTTKYKPIIFSVLGFALSSIVTIFIFKIFNDFYLLSA
jgi:hypothetical protein